MNKMYVFGGIGNQLFNDVWALDFEKNQKFSRVMIQKRRPGRQGHEGRQPGCDGKLERGRVRPPSLWGLREQRSVRPFKIKFFLRQSLFEPFSLFCDWTILMNPDIVPIADRADVWVCPPSESWS